MAISITCRCGNIISAPERLAGRTLRCPKCLGEFTVPQMVAPPPPPPAPAPYPTPAPLAAMATMPEAPAAAFAPEATLPEVPEQTLAAETPMEMPLAEAPMEMPLAEAPMEMAAAPSDDLGFMVMEEEAPLEMVSEEVSEMETQAGSLVAEQPAEGAMAFGEGDLAATQESPVMGEDELGMFLMEDEAPAAPPPEKKKKKKKADEDDDNVFG